jgi:hypothetical protein
MIEKICKNCKRIKEVPVYNPRDSFDDHSGLYACMVKDNLMFYKRPTVQTDTCGEWEIKNP